MLFAAAQEEKSKQETAQPALIKNPDILILDEPTSGLDGMNMKTMSKMMKEFAEQGKCVLVITHDLELIAEACSYQIRLPLEAPTVYK